MGRLPPTAAPAARVLLSVADDRARAAVRRALAREGHVVMGGRAEARALGPPAVVVADWPLAADGAASPVWTGPADAPLVALVPAGDPRGARAALAAGAADCVLGRVRPSEVTLRVAAVLERAGWGDDQDADPPAGVIEALPAAVAVLGPTGALARVNDRFRALVGEVPAAGAPVAELLPEADPVALEDLFRRARRAGGADAELTIGHPPRPVVAHLTATRDDAGTVSAYVLALRAPEEDHGLARALAHVARAAGAPDADVHAVLAREAARLVGARAALLIRRDERGSVVAGAAGRGVPPAGSALGAGDGARAAARALRSAAGPGTEVVTVPLRVAGRVWGRVGVAVPTGAGPAARARLERFAQLAAIAVAGVDVPGSAARTRDPLTGLLTFSAFFARLADEAGPARRAGVPVSLALVDLDEFKRVNDLHGHPAGDAAVTGIARRLQEAARPGDVVGRVGGEEFGWLMPGVPLAEALVRAEAARRAIGAAPYGPVGVVTASVGVAGLAADDPGRPASAEELHRQAEVALQWAKLAGRDRSSAYSFAVAEEVFGRQAALLAETPSLRAMRALAWAVDARDPHTQRHSMRVADLAVRIGAALGWTAERLTQLREAGLVHDVGKIAVPDAVLFKPGPLDAAEFAVIRRHPEVGAQIVADVLSPQQADWVRAHHERWDGTGYPDRLAGEAIPAEARVLAVADAWDVMVSLRSYKAALPTERALAELRACAGTQFWPDAVDALTALMSAPPDAPPAAPEG